MLSGFKERWKCLAPSGACTVLHKWVNCALQGAALPAWAGSLCGDVFYQGYSELGFLGSCCLGSYLPLALFPVSRCSRPGELPAFLYSGAVLDGDR